MEKFGSPRIADPPANLVFQPVEHMEGLIWMVVWYRSRIEESIRALDFGERVPLDVDGNRVAPPK